MPEIPSFPEPTPTQLSRLQNGDADLFDRMIRVCEPHIHAMARNRNYRSVPIDDLIQSGRIAVWKALLKFKTEFGVAFENYASRAVKNAFISELHGSRVEDETMFTGLDDNKTVVRKRGSTIPLESSETSDPMLVGQEDDPSCERASLPEDWRRQLDATEYDIILLIYSHGMTQRQIGYLLGVSHKTVGKVHKRVLERLAKYIDRITN
jgi:RNA polymerase sigma-H factor